MLDQIVGILKKSKSVTISSHTRPDGDAIGSQLALGLFLEKKGISVSLINQDPAPYTLDWLPGIERLQIFDGSIDQRERIARADAVLICDTNTEDRLGEVGASLKSTSAKKILIDHHTDSEEWFDLSLSRVTASSTGQLVYEIIQAWDIEAIDNAIASSLYVAVMTDTGSFRFSNVTGDVHRLIADVLDRGQLDTGQIHANIYDRRSPEGIELLSQVLATLEMHFDGAVGSMVISRRALGETGASIEEAEGFVNHILSIDGIRVALLFTETERGTKVSFRSKGEDHVHKWAQALGGGGHKNASGAFIRKPLEKSMKRAVEMASTYIHFGSDGASIEENLKQEDAEYLTTLINEREKGSVE